MIRVRRRMSNKTRNKARDRIFAEMALIEQRYPGAKPRQLRVLFLADRDGWTCWLCRQPVDQKLIGLGWEMSPSYDHVLPKSKGGWGFLDNLRIAHIKCNRERGSRTVKAA